MAYLRILSLIIIFSGISLAEDWTLFKTPEGNFEALFPAEPVKQNQNIGNDSANSANVVLYMYRDDKKPASPKVYVAGSYPIPGGVIGSASDKADIKYFLDKTRDGALTKIQGKLVNEKEINYKGKFPGRIIKLSYGQGQLLHYKFILYNSELYFQQLVTNEESNEDSDRFFSSFKILK